MVPGYRVFHTVVIGCLLLVAGAVSAAECEFCGKHISQGRFFQFERSGSTLTVCESCNIRNGHCMLCGVPVTGTNPGATEILCRDCRLTAKYCSVCGGVIQGRFYESGNGIHIYCESCFNHAPRCDACSDLLRPNEWRRTHALNLCSRCDATLSRCHACSKPILDTVIQFTGFEGEFCESCVSQKPACISCGRPCARGALSVGGYHVCGHCAHTAVLSSERLNTLAGEVRRLIHTELMLTFPQPVQYELVESLNKGDDSYRENGLFISRNGQFTIQIQKGLSKPVCIETLAHELGHAWLTAHVPGVDSELVREGFAQWVAFQVDEISGYEKMLDRFWNRPDVYGQGFEKLKELEKRRGVDGMFQWVRSQSNR